MCYKLCKPQKVTLDRKEITLRNPRMTDVEFLQNFINSFVEEDAPIGANRKFTFKDEKEWLKTHLGETRKGNAHMLLAVNKNEVIANVSITRGKWRNVHVGTIGILVEKNYRGIGLGKLLMKKIIEVAKKDPEIKVLTLSVFPVNKVAMNLYKKLRFKIIAKLPKRHLYKGKYVDEYIMDYPLKEI